MSSRTATKNGPVVDLDDLSDDSLAEGMPTPDSAAENKAPAKRGPARPTTKKAPTKTAVRRVSGAKGAVAASKPKGKRAPLKDTTNTQDGNETEEVDDFAQSDTDLAANMAPRKGSAAKPAKKTAVSKARVSAAAREIPESQPEAALDDVDQPKPKKGRKPKAQSEKRVVSETQPDEMDVDADLGHAVEDETSFGAAGPAATRGDHNTSTARQWTQPPPRKQHGSTSDTERPHDPTLRRQLTEMSRKFDALNLKYRNLKDVVSNEGEDNFAKLKRLTDQQTKASEMLISSLRAELAAEVARAKEAASGQAQLELIIAKRDELAEENKALKASLQQSQNDLKIMHAKLAATRSGSASVHEQPGRGPGSEVKQNRMAPAAHSEVAKEAQKQLLKEDLYGDLTGLLIRDVKRKDEEEEDVFDCIQTGRNGSKSRCLVHVFMQYANRCAALRFYLTVQNPNPGSKIHSDYSYADAEFQYAPVLDASNDRQLISILPDYLTDEICFPRSQAAKFYARIQDCMSKKFELVDGNEE